MQFRKGGLPLETVILAVLFIAVLAIVVLMVSSLVGKGTDSGGKTIEDSMGGTLCEIQCMRCCGSPSDTHKDCSTITFNGVDLSKCCEDTKPLDQGC